MSGNVDAWSFEDGAKLNTLISGKFPYDVTETCDGKLLLALDKTTGTVSSWNTKLDDAKLTVGQDISHIFPSRFEPHIIGIACKDGDNTDLEVMDSKTNTKPVSMKIEQKSEEILEVKLTENHKYAVFTVKKEHESGLTYLKVKAIEMISGSDKVMTTGEVTVHSAEVIDCDHVLLGSIGKAVVWKITQTIETTMKTITDPKWLTHTKKIKGKQQDDDNPILLVVVSHDSTRFVTGSTRGGLIVWNNVLKSSKAVTSGVSLKGHTDMVSAYV